MIYVKRTPPPPRLDLTDIDSAGASELQRAKDHLRDTNLPMAADQFVAYAHNDVRSALATLFKNKCAYCESHIAGSSQTDIEHYRPKGRVDKNDDHPGYWWLAMDWSNLVLSCMHCNQSRRQLILSPDLTEAEIKQAIIDNDLTTTGKKNAFPTEDDVWVTDPGTDVATERPLLLDPTVTDPEPLLDWGVVAEFAQVRARNGDRRAEVTIKTLGLNRRYLLEERMTKYNSLLTALNHLRVTFDELSSAQTDGEKKAWHTSTMQHYDTIAELGQPEKPHAALARDFLAQAKALIAATIT